MIIKNIFDKNINRNIETVIKADDRENISSEVEEYVITREIASRLEPFFESYNNYHGVNGVWISGFFGSGKSHLLKILSYVLEDKTYDGKSSGEIFANKIDSNNALLKANVTKATRIPSESVLFNIDQQAQITTKSDENAVLSVFYKVFYDHLGFFGAQMPVAQFEHWLYNEKKYAAFVEQYNSLTGITWETDRRKYFAPKVKDAISKVLGGLYNDDPSKYKSIIDEIRKDLRLSIEDFSERVNSYIKSKEKGFHLNFFVDEVGQYISDNTKLMLNLQTIAESLATKTSGQSWILVTSQEDMEKVVLDMNAKQQNDFSRIQARFGIKMNLSSANVDEVIEKRLLKKKSEPQEQLKEIYNKEKVHLKSLLSFSEEGVQFNGYKNEKDFANKYPFVAYQFDLFQQCRIALSRHNAFQGKHSSVGERSMLGVFQQVVTSIEDGNETRLVSFDKMYEGIRNELRSEIQNSIIMAENNLADKFAIQVLKALFLVKYFDNFKTTKRNIITMMIDDMHIDFNVHKKRVEEALNILENQSYVQRNDNVYEFLTDNEKDIEKEIKDTELDDQTVTQYMKELFFDQIIGDSRIRYTDNKQNYEFASRIDDILVSKEKELEIEIITPNYHLYENIGQLQSRTMGAPKMILHLPADATFMKDVKMYLRTNTYIMQKQSRSNTSDIMRILHEKSQLNRERGSILKLKGNELLAKATVYMNGSPHEMGNSSEGKNRVVNAFQDLVKIAYPNLQMLGNYIYTEETIRTILTEKGDDLFQGNDESISEAESEIFGYINRRKNQSDRTTLNDLRENFSRRPYGWYQNATFSKLAQLQKRSKVVMRQDSNELTDREAFQALMNTHQYGITLLQPQEVIDTRLVKQLKDIYADAFNHTCAANEAKEVVAAFKEQLNLMYTKVKGFLNQTHEYHFLNSLHPFAEFLETLKNRKDSNYYFFNIGEFENQLLDYKEDLLDSIQPFMNSEQKNIYDDIKSVIQGNKANLTFVEGDEFKTLEALMDSETPYRGNQIRDAKLAKDQLTSKILQAIDDEKAKFAKAYKAVIDAIQSRGDFDKLTELQQAEVLKPFNAIKRQVEDKNYRYIAVIRSDIQHIENQLYEKQLNLMSKLLTPKPTPTSTASGTSTTNVGAKASDGADDGMTVEEPARKRYIMNNHIHVSYQKNDLTTESDVDEYIQALRDAYLKKIKDNHIITLKKSH